MREIPDLVSLRRTLFIMTSCFAALVGCSSSDDNKNNNSPLADASTAGDPSSSETLDALVKASCDRLVACSIAPSADACITEGKPTMQAAVDEARKKGQSCTRADLDKCVSSFASASCDAFNSEDFDLMTSCTCAARPVMDEAAK